MREECKHFQSRTYASGEVARFCRLDLAPEAPWRCPEDCPRYERRTGDAGWAIGSLVSPKVEEEPAELHEDVGELLDKAEDIVNAVGPSIVADVDKQREASRSAQPWWRRIRRQR
jgi:hypothetical protein